MDYKKEMQNILDELKKKNHSRRKIEQYFGYADRSLDQILSKGGNEIVLSKLREYKRLVDEDKLSIDTAVEHALIHLLLLEIAKLKSKIYGISIDDAVDELEKNARIALRQIENREP